MSSSKLVSQHFLADHLLLSPPLYLRHYLEKIISLLDPTLIDSFRDGNGGIKKRPFAISGHLYFREVAATLCY